MKKVILAVLFVLAMVGLANAGPFLTCDCSVATDNVTGAKLQFGTSAWIDVQVVATCGTVAPVVCTGTSKTICYDLASLPTGPFTVKGRFVNSWAESTDSLPFSDTKVVPSGPSITRIVK